MYGWSGRLLDIDLSDKSFEYDPTPYLKEYVGGRGLGVRLFTERASPKADPLGPECPLIFSFGPLTGTIAPASGRFSAISKSPLTHTILDSNCGGYFAARGKGCGIDAFILSGQSESPCIVVIDEQGVGFDDAGDLMGKDICSTSAMLKSRYGKGCGILAIGPAGENLVLFSTISTDDYRVFGRGGLGAVMGSKNVKAIVALGRKKTSVAHPDQLRFVFKQSRKLLEANPITSRGLKAFGTPILVNIINQMGIFPNYNYQYSYSDKASMVCGEVVDATIFKRRRACLACTIQCDRVTESEGRQARGPEYESLWALGPNCGVFDLPEIAKSCYYANELGMDTMSLGATISCMMELKERGIADLPLDFSMDGIYRHVIDAAYKRDAGEDIAMGSKRVSEKYGAPEYALQVKGLDLPAYDPRGCQGMGLAYAVSNRGACHLRSYILSSEILGIPKLLDRKLTAEKVSLEVVLENINAAVDSLALCRFTSFALSEEYYSRLLKSVTDVDYSENDFVLLGERIWNLERIFNQKIGFTHKDDTLPERILSEPVKNGPAKGQVCRLDEMLPGYYRARGWSTKGVAHSRKLKELGLEDV